MMTNEMLYALMEIAEQMIQVGAEINRVEDSVLRVCRAYGVQRVDVYATTSNVIVSVVNEEGSMYTQTRRILSTDTDIERLDRLNSLVRRMTARKPPVEEVREELARISSLKAYPVWAMILSNGVAAGSFYLFFGGRQWAECLITMGIALFVGSLARLMERYQVNKLMGRFLCSACVCIGIFSFYRLGVIASVDNVIIGNIMTLIPGIGFTNALRELFTGNSITGILRSIESILLAFGIAGGYILTAYLFGGVV